MAGQNRVIQLRVEYHSLQRLSGERSLKCSNVNLTPYRGSKVPAVGINSTTTILDHKIISLHPALVTDTSPKQLNRTAQTLDSLSHPTWLQVVMNHRSLHGVQIFQRRDDLHDDGARLLLRHGLVLFQVKIQVVPFTVLHNGAKPVDSRIGSSEGLDFDLAPKTLRVRHRTPSQPLQFHY